MRRTIEWAAGLFEGEGSICVRMRKRGRQEIQVSLVSTDKDVVRLLPSNRTWWMAWSLQVRVEQEGVLDVDLPHMGRSSGDLPVALAVPGRSQTRAD